MLAFVDESGDAGRKIQSGSSRFFVVALVTFEDYDEAQQCDDRIGQLRGELGLSADFEFHYSVNSRRIREAFLSAVSPFQFFYHVFAVDKAPGGLAIPGFGNDENLYQFTTRMAFENAAPHLNDARVVIDKSGDRKFRNELSTYLRRRIRDEGGRQLISKVKIQRSDGNNLLQLADYVAGVSSRSLRDKEMDVAFRERYLLTHEVSLKVWP